MPKRYEITSKADGSNLGYYQTSVDITQEHIRQIAVALGHDVANLELNEVEMPPEGESND